MEWMIVQILHFADLWGFQTQRKKTKTLFYSMLWEVVGFCQLFSYLTSYVTHAQSSACCYHLNVTSVLKNKNPFASCLPSASFTPIIWTTYKLWSLLSPTTKERKALFSLERWRIDDFVHFLFHSFRNMGWWWCFECPTWLPASFPIRNLMQKKQ